jgi:hypothetical protein
MENIEFIQKLPFFLAALQIFWKTSRLSSIGFHPIDFPTSLPDFFLAAFGCHCFPQTFRIVGNLPDSVATTLPVF